MQKECSLRPAIGQGMAAGDCADLKFIVSSELLQGAMGWMLDALRFKSASLQVLCVPVKGKQAAPKGIHTRCMQQCTEVH